MGHSSRTRRRYFTGNGASVGNELGLADGTAPGEVWVWDGTAWNTQQPAETDYVGLGNVVVNTTTNEISLITSDVTTGSTALQITNGSDKVLGSTDLEVDLTSGGTDGDVLTWNSSTSQWVSQQPAATSTGDVSSSTSIITLGGTPLGAAVGSGFSIDLAAGGSDGELLTWDASTSQWVAQAPAFVGDLTAITVVGNGLTLTNGTGPIPEIGLPGGIADGHVLTWNSTLGQWESQPSDDWGSQVVISNPNTFIGDGTASNPLDLVDGSNPDDVLTWDGTNWIPQTNNGWQIDGNAGTSPASNFLGTTDNNGLSLRTNNTEAVRISSDQNVGIGTSSPDMKLHVDVGVENETGLLVEGETDFSTGAIPNLGEGTRLMWVPRKAAFRVGRVFDNGAPYNGQHWNDANVGTQSIAMGFNTVANSNLSVAIGNEAEALASGAIAIGDNAIANGQGAFAGGLRNTADGVGSVVLGQRAVSEGRGGAAMGFELNSLSHGEVVVGLFNDNTGYSATDVTNYNAADRVFVVGNGENNASRSNAMVVMKTGNIGIGENTPDQLLHVRGGRIRVDDGSDPYDLPAADGSNGNIMVTDGSGDVSWQSLGAAGALTEIVAGDGLGGTNLTGPTVTLDAQVNNGLSIVSDNIGLGGTLIRDTDINQDGNLMSFTGAGQLSVNSTSPPAGTRFYAEADATNQTAIQGTSDQPGVAAVVGEMNAAGVGVLGTTTAGSSGAVQGQTTSSDNTAAGVSGFADATSGITYGVTGTTASNTDGSIGVFGLASGAGAVTGVQGQVGSTTDFSSGVTGIASGLSGEVVGVYGETSSTTDETKAVHGIASAGTGATRGVQGEVAANTSGSFGVAGFSLGTTANGTIGVYGRAITTGTGAGLRGEYQPGGASGGTGAGAGVVGLTDAFRGPTTGPLAGTVPSGVLGQAVFNSFIPGGLTAITFGVSGVNASTNTEAVAVYGESFGGGLSVTGPTAPGTANGSAGIPFNGAPWAGFFNGDLGSSAAKFFHIDHPLDPENYYLNHYSIEGPEPYTMYTGMIETDSQGFATVELPDYFESLNTRFTYNLTVVNEFAQAIVKEKIANNQFVIQTDKPEVEVSWTVTAVRNDPYMQRHKRPVVEEKSDETKGRYLMPHLYDQPKEKAIYGVGSLEKVNIKRGTAPKTRPAKLQQPLPVQRDLQQNDTGGEAER